MAALLAFLLLALPAKPVNPGVEGGSPAPREEARFVFAWRGVPVGMVTLKLAQSHFTYVSQHLHTRDGQAGERRREVTLAVDAAGRVKAARGAGAEDGARGRSANAGQEGGERSSAAGGRAMGQGAQAGTGTRMQRGEAE
ncbi:transglutaminase domain-containing protein, partial [Pyxidicoccus sp. 3LFB2]